MKPEKTILTIWIQLFGVCLAIWVALAIAAPGWWLVYIALAFAVPSVIAWTFHIYREADNRRMEKVNTRQQSGNGNSQ
jgi:hypothetical protein